ncbi:MAG: hypothetical protein VKJ09_15730, partial [Leptolyngbya sp.]|nr:hypothetical protein [Leptolyngbya sp.]
MSILDFISNEAGQRRRAELEGLLTQFIPPEMRSRVSLLNELNPVTSMERASQDAQRIVDPSVPAWARVGAVGDMLSNVAGVVAPAMVANRAGIPVANALTESLAGFGGQVDDAARYFYMDEDGALRLFHGSPHDFDRFDMSKIGTGEGAQAYGHGLYFAESPDVARAYRDTITKNQARSGGISARTAIAEAFQSSDLVDPAEIDANFLRGVAINVADDDVELAAEILQMSPDEARRAMGR